MKYVTIILATCLAVVFTPVKIYGNSDTLQQGSGISRVDYLDSLLKSRHYQFVPIRANTSTPGVPYVNINEPYSFQVKGDTILSDMPYIGTSNTFLESSQFSPLSFVSYKYNYDARKVKRSKREVNIIDFEVFPKPEYDHFYITLEVTSDYQAKLNVRSNRYSSISFSGKIKPIDE